MVSSELRDQYPSEGIAKAWCESCGHEMFVRIDPEETLVSCTHDEDGGHEVHALRTHPFYSTRAIYLDPDESSPPAAL